MKATQQNSALALPMNLTVRVQVGQPLQGTVGDGSNLHFLKWFLVNYGENPRKHVRK